MGRKQKIILGMNRCGVCKWKERVRKIKSLTEGKNILYMQMRKQKHRRSSWPPGPCQSSLSLLFFLPLPSSHCLPLHTWLWQPHSLQLQYKRLIGRGGRTGCKQQGGKETRLAKRSINKGSWQLNVSPLPFTKILLSIYH